jgi:hypothetical protein
MKSINYKAAWTAKYIVYFSLKNEWVPHLNFYGYRILENKCDVHFMFYLVNRKIHTNCSKIDMFNYI